MDELPELRETLKWTLLKWTLYQARAEARRQTRTALDPAAARELTAQRVARLVQNGDQLLDVAAESLGRLEAKLQGETPAVPDLWN
jgi:hypothetical protein